MRLLERRFELGDDAKEDWRTYYKWVLRGGKWTGAKKGVAFDCYAPSALCDTEASDLVDHYPSLNMSASFSIQMYGDAAALSLARAWIHRHFYFLGVWMAAHCSYPFAFTDAHVNAYVEPAELSHLAAHAAPGSKLAKRIGTIRAVRPR